VSTASSAPSHRRRDDTRGPTELVDSRITSPSVREDDTTTEHENTNDDTLSEVVMAIDMTPRGTVGCCYYVSREEKLYFMEDIQIGDVNIVDTREALVRTRRAKLISIQSKTLLILP
jgi:DNA mismatch repair protein MSH5